MVRLGKRSLWIGTVAICVALAALLFLPPASRTKVPRVGILTLAPHSGIEAFRQALRDLGYVEGRNIVLELRSAQGNEERLPALADELVNLKAEVILADGDRAAREVQRLTTTIPMVITTGDPVEAGLVASAAHPGGNSTGVSIVATGLHLKRFELLKDSLPGVTRVAYLWHAWEDSTRDVGAAERAASSLGMQLIPVEVADPYPFEEAFAAMAKARAEALVPMPSPLFASHMSEIVAQTERMRLPAIFIGREFAQAGGLIAYGPDISAVFRRAASQVDKILRGAKPGDLPVEYPKDFELVVNLKTAKDLGLTIPRTVLIRATEVIPP
jgi:putative ABC transport system substrate-binding protein